MRRIFLFFPAFLAAIPYHVDIIGLKDEAALKSLFDASDLVVFQDRPPASLNGLRYRVSSDIPSLLRVLRAYGYYDANISSDVQLAGDKAQVSLFIHPGPQYQIASYEVYRLPCTELAVIPPCGPLTPQKLGVEIGMPAISTTIVNAELNLLAELSRCGYPLASVEKRRVEVDMADKTVHAASCIEEGPYSKFGPVSIFGLNTVKPRYVMRRIAWEEGQAYNSDVVEETQKRLLNSDLFSSVMISHNEALDAEGELSMQMRITEAKHKQVTYGVFYATVDGPGVTFAWANRNVRGMGETISLDGDFSQRYLAGKLTYKKPDFLTIDQVYRALAQIEREHIHPYTSFSYTFANYIDRKFDAKRSFSVGLEASHILVTDSASNGSYLLLSLPVYFRYNGSDDLLNPTKGFTIVYQGIPFQSLEHSNQHFYKQRLTTTFYVPLQAKKLIFATRIQLGSIAGAPRRDVPLPLLFLGGSEDDLRGYRYKTVSPLNSHRKPYGGRSAVFLSFEARFRFSETIGIVPFADLGTVTFPQLPQFDTKWFKSVGVGLRYFTFFGPLRADIGFPLNRRHGVDPPFRIYVSIGQTF
jgi:translocation and assembly module TamA